MALGAGEDFFGVLEPLVRVDDVLHARLGWDYVPIDFQRAAFAPFDFCIVSIPTNPRPIVFVHLYSPYSFLFQRFGSLIEGCKPASLVKGVGSA
jgi:hypothetical protein